jgi:hypothetical protein
MQSTLPPIDTLAEINTALAMTYIQEGVATSLGLEPGGKMLITSTTKPKHEVHLYRLRIAFPEEKMVFEVIAAEVPYIIRPRVRVKCCIGRDILQYGLLTYDGPNHTLSLKF